jgi:hypothetical protein
VRKPLHEDSARVSMNDGESKSWHDRCLDGMNELGAQTGLLMLVLHVGGFDIILRRREEAGCSDGLRRRRRRLASAQVMTAALPLSISSRRRSSRSR